MPSGFRSQPKPYHSCQRLHIFFSFFSPTCFETIHYKFQPFKFHISELQYSNFQTFTFHNSNQFNHQDHFRNSNYIFQIFPTVTFHHSDISTNHNFTSEALESSCFPISYFRNIHLPLLPISLLHVSSLEINFF